jgi:hypothetical protein
MESEPSVQTFMFRACPSPSCDSDGVALTRGEPDEAILPWIVVCFMCVHESSYVYRHVTSWWGWPKSSKRQYTCLVETLCKTIGILTTIYKVCVFLSCMLREIAQRSCLLEFWNTTCVSWLIPFSENTFPATRCRPHTSEWVVYYESMKRKLI